MEVVTSRQMSSSSSSSALNPNAPLFVPRAYRDVLWAVEDFSDEWWELVHSSPWFRDYWLQECFQDPQNNDLDHFLPEIDQVFDGYTTHDDVTINKRQEEQEEEIDDDDEKENVKDDYYMDLVSLGALKWRRSSSSSRGGASETPKYLVEKVPKFVNINKVNPRPIQQPR